MGEKLGLSLKARSMITRVFCTTTSTTSIWKTIEACFKLNDCTFSFYKIVVAFQRWKPASFSSNTMLGTNQTIICLSCKLKPDILSFSLHYKTCIILWTHFTKTLFFIWTLDKSNLKTAKKIDPTSQRIKVERAYLSDAAPMTAALQVSIATPF